MQNVSLFHIFCDHASKGKGNDEKAILCTVLFKTDNDVKGKIDSKFNLEIQAKQMKMIPDKKFPPASLRAIGRVVASHIDKGQDDSRNLLAVIMSVIEDGFYRLGISERILKQLHA